MEPIKTEVLKLLSNCKIYNVGLKMGDGLLRFGGKPSIKSEIEKSEDIIDNMDSKDFCSDSTLSKIESNRKNLEEKEKEYSNILTSKDKEFISSLKQKMNLLKSECQRLKSEIENNTEVVDNSEKETDPNVITINSDNPVEGCPPVDDDGCSDIGEWEINNYIKSPLEIHLLFGVNKTGTGSCGAPKKKRIPEDLTNSITSIVDVSYPSMWEEGHIEFCKTQKFPEVTNITNSLKLNGSLENFNEIFPKLKSVNEVVIDYLSDTPEDDILDLDILKDVDIEYLHIGFSKLKDGWEEKLNKIEKISVDELESDIEDKLNELGWGVEVEGDEEYSSEYYVNPKNKVQEPPQVDVIGGKEGAEEEDDSDTDEKEVQSVGKPTTTITTEKPVQIIDANGTTWGSVKILKNKKDEFVIKTGKKIRVEAGMSWIGRIIISKTFIPALIKSIKKINPTLNPTDYKNLYILNARGKTGQTIKILVK
jgi:hypothetical protein